MIAVGLSGIDRPGLVQILAARGMRVAVGDEPAKAMLSSTGPGPAGAWIAEVADTAAVIDALDAGADDAVFRSDGDALVAARLAVVVRRSVPATIILGDLKIDTVDRRVTRAGRRVPLLPREYALLLHFARAPAVTHDRASLRAAVWGLDFDPGTNVVEVHMSRLRAKLDRGALPILLTDKGRGYRLVPAPLDPAVFSASG